MITKIDSDFEEYLDFIKKNIPNSLYINATNNKELFISVNTAFKLSDILTDFEFVSAKDNYYNLLVEYKRYFARILSAVSLNDQFLVNNISRLLTEKLYRILVGAHNPARGERRIRSHSKKSMSDKLNGILNNDNKIKLDKLYDVLSNSIHNTISDSVDMYDIRKLISTPSSIIIDTINITEELTDIFIHEVFLKKCCEEIDNCGTSFWININNNLSEKRVIEIQSKLQVKHDTYK